ncbi:hypothetical protein KCU64_g2427, partial [Aureobasidium melanogenum]
LRDICKAIIDKYTGTSSPAWKEPTDIKIPQEDHASESDDKDGTLFDLDRDDKRIVVNTFGPPELDKALTVISEEEASVRRQADLIDTERQAERLLLMKDVGVTAKQTELRIADLLYSQQRLEAHLKKLEAPFTRTSSQMTLLHNSLGRSEKIELLLWLSKVPHREHHRIIPSQIPCGSGQWLLQDQEFISWMASSASEIFWLYGPSGSGKTKLVSIVIENLKTGMSNLKNATPIYCPRALAEPERADPCEILRSIIKQLSQSQSGILQSTVDSFEQNRLEAEVDGLPPSTLILSECKNLLLQIVNTTPATIVIDALDECDPTRRHHLLSFFNNIITTSQNVVKIFITSRDEIDLRAHIAHCDRIRITEEQNCHDIQKFVVTEVDQAIKNRRLLCGNVPHDLREHVVNELIGKAQGMFRWASLQVETLCDPEQVIREQDVIQTLAKLPSTLSKFYDVVFGHILRLNAGSRSIAVTTLQWLLGAGKILFIEEFQAALSDSGASIISTDDVTGCCCGLVEIDKGMNTLRPTHPSVREYLEGLPQFSKNEVTSNIAERCLAANMNYGGTTLNKLADYAVMHWAHHCAAANASSHLGDILSKFLFHRNHFDGWLDVLEARLTDMNINSELAKKLHAVQIKPTSPPFVLSCFGLFRLLDESRLETSITDWHQCNLSGASALNVAARWGHLDAVKYLVRLGLNVNCTGGQFGHALQASAFAGHHQTIAFSIDNGATTSGPGESFDPVYAAISSGNGEIASMILEKGYKFSSQQKFEECLKLAAFKGHVDLMLSMLQGINSVFSPKQIHDILQVALYGRNEREVNLLIIGYGDINAETGYFGNALHAAICGGTLKLVQYVLAQGADLHTRGRFGYPLRAAVAFGHEEVLQWLLTDKESDPNIQDEELGDCPQTAALKGYLAIMTLLLDQGADVKGSGGVDQDALQAACFGGHQAAVQLLLRNHADIRYRGCYRNALQAAVFGASKNVVKILLEYGAEWDLSLQNQWMQRMPVPGRLSLPDPWRESWSDGAGPLEAAALTGNLSFDRLLIDKGTTLTANCGWEGNLALEDADLPPYRSLHIMAMLKSWIAFWIPLHAAIQDLNFSLASKFLERGAKIDKFWGPRYGTCLQMCSDQGNLAGVKFLVDHGASVNGLHGRNGTALQLSSDGGHFEIVELLISHDVDLEAHGEFGTALQAATAKGHFDVVFNFYSRMVLKSIPSMDPMARHFMQQALINGISFTLFSFC